MVTHIISFSGGLGSAVSAIAAKERGIKFKCVFADTLIEDDDLHRFMRDIESALGIEVVRLRDGRNPWEVFRDRKYQGNSRLAHCSQELKTKVVRDWLKENAKPGDPLVLGMDWSEMDRIDRAKKAWNPRPVVSLLCEWGIHRPQWKRMLERYGVRVPRLYEKGFTHNNCGGFCVRAGVGQFRRLLRVFPDRYRTHEKQQDRLMSEMPNSRPFLKYTERGETKYMTMRELREMDERQLDLFDDGASGCGCFTDADTQRQGA